MKGLKVGRGKDGEGYRWGGAKDWDGHWTGSGHWGLGWA